MKANNSNNTAALLASCDLEPLPLDAIFDEDASVSSTFLVEDVMPSKLQQQFQSDEPHRPSQTTSGSKRKRKCVEFNTSTTTVHEAATSTEDLWYNAQDYGEFKQSCKRACKEIILLEIQEAPHRACRTAVQAIYESYSNQSEEEEEEVDITHSTPQEDQVFATWINSLDRHGLESGANRFLANDKTVRRIELTDMLLHLQQTLANYPEIPADVKDQVIADACQRQTKPSQRLAFQLGRCHAAAQESTRTTPTLS
eukprot:CAMPEP_0172441298 /NCGR_PEP_ID=MMETSP1065-20121228/1841_1 /TAXON_ID=265537 /ORGANISM="Amphiprora paludosa, Strain CCMP125" /LENGTH=254 /DNA_ID=CAMNT_0013190565 /DNA_START=151 /DNA_END=915 /DNA_ORIENTATION=+